MLALFLFLSPSTPDHPFTIVRLPFSATPRDNERKLLLLMFRCKITPVEASHATLFHPFLYNSSPSDSLTGESNVSLRFCRSLSLFCILQGRNYQVHARSRVFTMILVRSFPRNASRRSTWKLAFLRPGKFTESFRRNFSNDLISIPTSPRKSNANVAPEKGTRDLLRKNVY